MEKLYRQKGEVVSVPAPPVSSLRWCGCGVCGHHVGHGQAEWTSLIGPDPGDTVFSLVEPYYAAAKV